MAKRHLASKWLYYSEFDRLRIYWLLWLIIYNSMVLRASSMYIPHKMYIVTFLLENVTDRQIAFIICIRIYKSSCMNSFWSRLQYKFWWTDYQIVHCILNKVTQKWPLNVAWRAFETKDVFIFGFLLVTLIWAVILNSDISCVNRICDDCHIHMMTP